MNKNLINNISKKFYWDKKIAENAIRDYLYPFDNDWESIFKPKENRVLLELCLKENNPQKRIDKTTEYIFKFIQREFEEKLHALISGESIFNLIAKFNIYDFVNLLDLSANKLKKMQNSETLFSERTIKENEFIIHEWQNPEALVFKSVLIKLEMDIISKCVDKCINNCFFDPEKIQFQIIDKLIYLKIISEDEKYNASGFCHS